MIGYNHDKASLGIFWLRDEALEESDNLPAPDVSFLEAEIDSLSIPFTASRAQKSPLSKRA